MSVVSLMAACLIARPSSADWGDDYKVWSEQHRKITAIEKMQELCGIDGDRHADYIAERPTSVDQEDWPRNTQFFVRVQQDNVALLSMPDISTKVPECVAIARAGEIYQYLGTKEQPVRLHNPFDRGPFNDGTWFRVKSLDGQEGWIFAKPAHDNVILAARFERITTFVPVPDIPSLPDQTQQRVAVDSDQIALVKTKIEKRLRTIPPVPEYLYETSSFTGAVATVWTDLTAPILGTRKLREKYDEFYTASLNYRSMAEMQLVYAKRFLENSDVDRAQQYTEEYHRYVQLFNLSNQGAIAVYQGNIESSREFAKGIYEGSKAAASYGADMIPSPWASSFVDGVFTVTDFVVDGTDIGFSGASKKAVSKVVAKTILDYAKIDELGGKSFSQALDEGITGAIGSSKLYSILDKSLQSPELQKQLMSVLARSASYGGRKLTKDQASKLIYAIVNSQANMEIDDKSYVTNHGVSE